MSKVEDKKKGVELNKSRSCTIEDVSTSQGHAHVDMGMDIIQELIEKNAKLMPHISRAFIDSNCEMQVVLPSMYNQVDILHEVNATLASLGYSSLSQPAFSHIWNTNF